MPDRAIQPQGTANTITDNYAMFVRHVPFLVKYKSGLFPLPHIKALCVLGSVV